MKSKYIITTENSQVVIIPHSVYDVLSRLVEGASIEQIAKIRKTATSTVRNLEYQGYNRLELIEHSQRYRIEHLREVLKKAKELPPIIRPPRAHSIEPSAPVDMDTLLQENSLARRIQDVRYAGASPLLQYDVLDSKALLSTLRAQNFSTKSRYVSKTLRALGMRPIGLHGICGLHCCLWTSLPTQDLDNIVHLVRERMHSGATELHRELVPDYIAPDAPSPSSLTSLERDVLSMRLQYYPPRRIATLLQVMPGVVYKVSQQVLKKLKLKSFSDRDELRKAAAPALMDDPAFR